MRILTLVLVMALAPAALPAQQEGPRRGRPVPARAVQEAAAVRAGSSKQAEAARRSQVPPQQPARIRPAQRPGGG